MTDTYGSTAMDDRNDTDGSGQKKRKFTSAAPRTTQKKAPAKKKKAPEEEDSTGSDDGFDDDEALAEEEDGGSSNPVDAEKRQKRLVKNRRAAQLFRKRQKQYIIDLEKQVNGLAAQNAAYSAKVDLLSAENNLIKDQLGYLRTFISKAVQLSFSNAGNGPGGSQQQQQQQSQQQQSSYKPPTLPPFNDRNILQHSSLPLPLPHPHSHAHQHHSGQHHSSNHNRHIPSPSDLLGNSEMHRHQGSPFERQ